MSDYDIHSCGYYCDRPACIERQRNELRDKLLGEIPASERNIQTTDTKPEESLQPLGQEPLLEGWPLWSGLPPAKVQDERETQYKSWAQSSQVIGTPQREWVGLTDEEYTELWGKKPDLLNFFRKIEAKLKEKNT